MICSAEVEDLMLNQNNEQHDLLMFHELKLCSDGQYSILCIVMEFIDGYYDIFNNRLATGLRPRKACSS